MKMTRDRSFRNKHTIVMNGPYLSDEFSEGRRPEKNLSPYAEPWSATKRAKPPSTESFSRLDAVLSQSQEGRFPLLILPRLLPEPPSPHLSFHLGQRKSPTSRPRRLGPD